MRSLLAVLAFLSVWLLGTADAADQSVRRWRSKSGHSVEAEFVKIVNRQVTLRRADTGKEIVVPLEKLSANDVRVIERLRRLERAAPRSEGNGSESVKTHVNPTPGMPMEAPHKRRPARTATPSVRYSYPRLHRVRVTDVTNEIHEVVDFQMGPSDQMRRPDRTDHLWITVADRPRKDVWVHGICLERVSLSKRPSSPTLDIEARLFDGSVISGRLAEPGLQLVGQGELGQVTLLFANVKTLEVIGFQQLKDGTYVGVDAVQGRTMEGFQQWRDDNAVVRWRITDGERIVTASSVTMVNDYYSQKYSSWQSFGGFFHVVDFIGERWPLRKGASDYALELGGVRRFEFLGSLTQGCPDVSVTKVDGAKVTATLALVSNEHTEGRTPDASDMLVWSTPYGYEGVPVLPVRPIVIERLAE